MSELDRVIKENLFDILFDVADDETPHDICDCYCDQCIESYRQVMIEQDKIDKMSNKEIEMVYGIK